MCSCRRRLLSLLPPVCKFLASWTGGCPLGSWDPNRSVRCIADCGEGCLSELRGPPVCWALNGGPPVGLAVQSESASFCKLLACIWVIFLKELIVTILSSILFLTVEIPPPTWGDWSVSQMQYPAAQCKFRKRLQSSGWMGPPLHYYLLIIKQEDWENREWSQGYLSHVRGLRHKVLRSKLSVLASFAESPIPAVQPLAPCRRAPFIFNRKKYWSSNLLLW